MKCLSFFSFLSFIFYFYFWQDQRGGRGEGLVGKLHCNNAVDLHFITLALGNLQFYVYVYSIEISRRDGAMIS